MRKLAILSAALALVAVSFVGCDETTPTEPAEVTAQNPTAPSFDVEKKPVSVVWLAPQVSSQGGGAYVINRGNGQPGPFSPGGCYHGPYSTDQTVEIHTPSGHYIIHCFFDNLPSIPKTEVHKGEECAWWIGGSLYVTTESHYTKTRNGHLAGTCKFRVAIPPPPKPNQ